MILWSFVTLDALLDHIQNLLSPTSALLYTYKYFAVLLSTRFNSDAIFFIRSSRRCKGNIKQYYLLVSQGSNRISAVKITNTSTGETTLDVA